jgi:hypothetical protein
MRFRTANQVNPRKLINKKRPANFAGRSQQQSIKTDIDPANAF